MWRPDEDIASDLASGDRDRIEAGVRDLAVRYDLLDGFPLAPFDVPSLLAPFGGNVPQQTLLGLLRILTHYDGFTPPLSPTDLSHALVDLVLGGDDERLALETSLVLKGSEDPDAAVAAAVAELGRRPLDAPRASGGAKRFVSYLLAGNPGVRTATLRTLREWPTDDGYRRVVDHIVPELSADERTRLTGA